jgi:hypothetical protein
MLLRIVPDMFIDERFECVTLRCIHDELVQTTKFRTKYPWIRDFKKSLKTLPASVSESQDALLHYGAVTALNQLGTINTKTNRFFDLSKEDRMVIACAAANNYTISSGDDDLIAFALQQYDITTLTPLEIINNWLTRKLLVWDDGKQKILQEWAQMYEKPQPSKAKNVFHKLTGYKYIGS